VSTIILALLVTLLAGHVCRLNIVYNYACVLALLVIWRYKFERENACAIYCFNWIL